MLITYEEKLRCISYSSVHCWLVKWIFTKGYKDILFRIDRKRSFQIYGDYREEHVSSHQFVSDRTHGNIGIFSHPRKRITKKLNLHIIDQEDNDEEKEDFLYLSTSTGRRDEKEEEGKKKRTFWQSINNILFFFQ